MNIKEIKNEIIKFGKTLAGIDFESEIVKLQEDEVKISDKAVGAKVEQVMQDGTLEPMQDGKFNLNGFVFEVKDGVITAIEGQEEAEVSEEMEEEKPAESEALPNQQVLDLQEQIDALVKEIETLKEEIKGAKESEKIAEEMKKEFSKLNATLEAFAKIPAEETKTNSSEEIKKEKEQKLNSFIGGFSKK